MIRAYAAGEIIFDQGSEVDGIYSVQTGKVSVYKTKPTPQGPVDIELVQLGPGSMFGEMGMLDQTKRDASVKAVEFTEVLIITKDMFENQTGAPAALDRQLHQDPHQPPAHHQRQAGRGHPIAGDERSEACGTRRRCRQRPAASPHAGGPRRLPRSRALRGKAGRSPSPVPSAPQRRPGGASSEYYISTPETKRSGRYPGRDERVHGEEEREERKYGGRENGETRG